MLSLHFHLHKYTLNLKCTCTQNAIVILTFPLSSELQGIDIGMVSYDIIVYASPELGTATIKVATRAGKVT